MSKKAKVNLKNRRHRRVRLGKFLGERITVVGNLILKSKAALSADGIKETVLVRNLEISGDKLCDHLWLKMEDIKNPEKLMFPEDENVIIQINFSGTPYFYNTDGRGKIQNVKYSLKDIYVKKCAQKRGGAC